MSDTPITDRRAFFADNRVGNTVLVVETETARQLERMCAELAEALQRYDGVFISAVELIEAKAALARWQAMKEEK